MALFSDFSSLSITYYLPQKATSDHSILPMHEVSLSSREKGTKSYIVTTMYIANSSRAFVIQDENLTQCDMHGIFTYYIPENVYRKQQSLSNCCDFSVWIFFYQSHNFFYSYNNKNRIQGSIYFYMILSLKIFLMFYNLIFSRKWRAKFFLWNYLWTYFCKKKIITIYH